MQFSDSTYRQGLVEDTRFLVSANSVSYPIEDVTRNINRRWDEAKGVLYLSDGRWQASETIYSANTVSGTQGYAIPRTHIKINRVEVTDADGKIHRLQPMDKSDVSGSIQSYEETDGTPMFYEVTGQTMNLYPAPNFSVTSGLKWWFQGVPDYFNTSDTTDTPDIIEIVDRFLSVGAAYDYAIAKITSNKGDLKGQLDELKQMLGDIANRRLGDENIVLKVRTISGR